MTDPAQRSASVWDRGLLGSAALVGLICGLTMIAVQSAQAQTFTVLHSFTGARDGALPTAGLTLHASGDLYGTASVGGNSCNCGVVFKLTRQGSGWTLAPLYDFEGGSDGNGPLATVIIAPNGTLYGTTTTGGRGTCELNVGCGTVFNLRPPVTAPKSALSSWTETVPYRFAGMHDAANPAYGSLALNGTGDLYGTTENGGTGGFGAVYKLTPSNGSWTESIVYSFTGGQGGKGPFSGVIFDNLGNLYGTNESGGAYGFGTVYQLTPSGSGWTENTLHSFSGGNDGAHPWGGLLFDNSGNFYGTSSGGEGGYGTVFQLTHSNGNWTYTVIHNFTGSDGQGPVDNLIMDANGSLYGTALDGGAHGYGSVFKLTPSEGSWTCISLHDFDGGDGGSPFGSLVFDPSGSLYGTTYSGGSYGLGIVFEITQ